MEPQLSARPIRWGGGRAIGVKDGTDGADAPHPALGAVERNLWTLVQSNELDGGNGVGLGREWNGNGRHDR